MASSDKQLEYIAKNSWLQLFIQLFYKLSK